MKYILIVLALFLTACSQQPATTSFADRAARAEALENTPIGIGYITDLLKEHGEGINTFAGECYANTSIQKDTFKLVADINPSGKIENVVVQPDTAPTRCYAQKIGQLTVAASRPLGYADKSFPLVINVNYNK
jgi:hypothetical protein